MRIIKFRAWDKENKEMFYPETENNNEDFFTGFKNGEVICLQNEYADAKDSPYRLMQYSGFTDSKGDEMYEGDIVEINHHKFYIELIKGSFMINRISESTCMYENFTSCWNDYMYPLSQYYWESNCEDDEISDCTVIGNIYENKELLEGDKQ